MFAKGEGDWSLLCKVCEVKACSGYSRLGRREAAVLTVVDGGGWSLLCLKQVSDRT